jgi:hypothetical protein
MFRAKDIERNGPYVLFPVDSFVKSCRFLGKKSDWGTLVPRIKIENGIKLGFLLE